MTQSCSSPRVRACVSRNHPGRQRAPRTGAVVPPGRVPRPPGRPADEAERAGAAQARGSLRDPYAPKGCGLFSGPPSACSIIRTSPVDAPWSSKAVRNKYLDRGGNMEKISPRAFSFSPRLRGEGTQVARPLRATSFAHHTPKALHSRDERFPPGHHERAGPDRRA
jgi:hypothetical protein